MLGLTLPAAIEPRRDILRSRLLRVIGSDREVARFVSEGTGDAIDVVTRPFVTIGFALPNARAFALVLHSMDDMGRLTLSADAAFVPWVPAIPRTIAYVAFRQMGAAEIVMRPHARDIERAVVASRLGFELVAFDGERVTLRLGRDTLRPALRRSLARHLH